MSRPTKSFDTAQAHRIVAQIAQEHGLTTGMMRGGGNQPRFVVARSDAICELRDTLGVPFAKIGKLLGGMHHATVIHHYRAARPEQRRVGVGDVARRHLGIIERQAKQLAQMSATIGHLSRELASLQIRRNTGLAG